ncbi:hypothetical protein B7P34_03070 [Streptosporangium nondiastaticum]|uniref:Uncharacterized protein n=1 Tax=Streptosporangium nondiastaticum TaxID=35764 RepID=A0A9X7JUV4_9ACTN|nr:hypothetical protein B7P34_03070 [Streptosporangium nondiastaticum]
MSAPCLLLQVKGCLRTLQRGPRAAGSPVAPPFVFMTDVTAEQALVTSGTTGADGPAPAPSPPPAPPPPRASR